MQIVTSPDVAVIVRPAWAVAAPVRVVPRDDRQDVLLRSAAALLRVRVESSDITAAVRQMYKQVGIDPTKTRPSSEALLRRLRKGDELPRINSLVDIINWCSVESQLPFGLYDLDRLRATADSIALRLGRPDESYPGIRKDDVHVAGRLVLADDVGAFGNPTSDSARTMVTVTTTRALVVIFAPAPVERAIAERALATTVARIQQFA